MPWWVKNCWMEWYCSPTAVKVIRPVRRCSNIASFCSLVITMIACREVTKPNQDLDLLEGYRSSDQLKGLDKHQLQYVLVSVFLQLLADI